MRLPACLFFVVIATLFWLMLIGQGVGADGEARPLSLDLNAAVERALQENPALKAKRHRLGSAQGRLQQANLLFQENPRLSVDIDYRKRRFAAPTGRSVVDTEVRLMQEVEIAGQRKHRREAATKNLARTRWSIADAERLLQLEVTRVFYDLLALQEKMAVQRQVLATQEDLLQVGIQRFAREDISVLELDTLRLDRDRAQSELVNAENDRELIAQQLHSLTGLGEERPLHALGDLSALATGERERRRLPPQEELVVCALANRPDLKAAVLALEGCEAEVQLAQAQRIPNPSVGPLYKLDNEDQVIGGAIVIPLPLFHRNQQAIMTALANLEVAYSELVARKLAVRQEVAAAYNRLQLAEKGLALYGIMYLDNLHQNAAFTQKAYEAGEMGIFELSVAQDRFAQARSRYIDATVAYLQIMAELEARATAECFAVAGPPAVQSGMKKE